MPTTRKELQSVPKEWFTREVNRIVAVIAEHVKEAARTHTYYEHDVLRYTNKSAVYSTSPRVVLEDVLIGLKREFPDSCVEIQREDQPGVGVQKLVIRIDWGIPEMQ